jgi:hypothetical protein
MPFLLSFVNLALNIVKHNYANYLVIYNIYKCKDLRSQFPFKDVYSFFRSCQPDDRSLEQNMMLWW